MTRRAATVDKDALIASLIERNAVLVAENAALVVRLEQVSALAEQLAAQVDQLLARIAELEAKSGKPPKTPHNSSIPPRPSPGQALREGRSHPARRPRRKRGGIHTPAPVVRCTPTRPASATCWRKPAAAAPT